MAGISIIEARLGLYALFKYYPKNNQLFSFEIDDFEIPRVHRFGTGIHLTNENFLDIPTQLINTLDSVYMTPPRPKADTFEKSEERVLDSAVSPSMIGQPPTTHLVSEHSANELSVIDEKPKCEDFDPDDMDDVIDLLYRRDEPTGKRRKPVNPDSWIMDARIDEKDVFLLDGLLTFHSLMKRFYLTTVVCSANLTATQHSSTSNFSSNRTHQLPLASGTFKVETKYY